MPDITMCLNEVCKKKYDCYRYMAIPNNFQSMCCFNAENCEHFYKIMKGDRIKKKENEDV